MCKNEKVKLMKKSKIKSKIKKNSKKKEIK